MSMAIKGLYSSDWLYTQTPLPRISFLQPWHCWHHSLSLSLSISSEREREQAQKRQEKMETAMEYQREGGKEECLTFLTSLMFRSFGYDFTGYRCVDAQTHQNKQFGSAAHVKVIMKAIVCFFSPFKYNFASFFLLCISIVPSDPITSVLLFDSRWYRWSYLVAHYPPHTYETLTAPLFHCSYAALFLLSIWTKSAATVATVTDMHYSKWHFIHQMWFCVVFNNYCSWLLQRSENTFCEKKKQSHVQYLTETTFIWTSLHWFSVYLKLFRHLHKQTEAIPSHFWWSVLMVTWYDNCCLWFLSVVASEVIKLTLAPWVHWNLSLTCRLQFPLEQITLFCFKEDIFYSPKNIISPWHYNNFWWKIAKAC